MKSKDAVPAKPLRSAKRFVRLLLAMQPISSLLSVSMTLASGLLGGCSILLLVPLLELIGTGQTGQQHGISHGFALAFQAVGLAPSLEVVLTLFLALVGVQALLGRQVSLVNARLQMDFGRALQDRLFESVVYCRWSFFAGTRRSDFMHVLTHDISRVSQGTINLLNLASSGVLVVVHLTLSILISPWLTLIVLAATALLAPLLMRLNRLASNTGRQLTDRSRDFYHRIEQQLAGMKEIKSLGSEAPQIERFQTLTADIRTAQLRFRRANANSMVVFSVGSAVLLSGLLLAAVNLFQVAAVELLVLVVIFAKLAPQFRQFQTQYQQLLHTVAAFDSATAMQARCDAQREPVATSSQLVNHPTSSRIRQNSEGTRPNLPNSGESGCTVQAACQREGNSKTCPAIELKDVGFRYDPQSSTWALRDINLTIPANQTTALVGPSGAGKSTLADLLLGLLSPTAGQIAIDGVPLDDQHLAGWRRRIGYVPQETFLLNDSIRANLLLARPDGSEEEVWQALDAAAASEFVAKLPQGLATVIGDRGVRLSGGERQRLALARAILRRPALLILDEATSNLDAENQGRIQSALERIQGAITVVVIAHRLSTIRHADRIVVLTEGRIVETGQFDDLLNDSDYFRDLVEADGMPRRLAG